ncbi:MAG: hypothetical protein SFZ23_14555 [Planctomycetota bacterium]|nr:hypothetical protein [Planctomycetota bacterium]
MYTYELTKFREQLGRQVPNDLYMFYSWFDSRVCTEVLRHVHFLSPTAFRFAVVSDEGVISEAEPIITFEDRVATALRTTNAEESTLAKPWASLQPGVLEFGECHGYVIAQCVGTSVLPHGSIMYRGSGDADWKWLANSLTQWFARMLACERNDPVLDPECFAKLPADIQSFVRSELTAETSKVVGPKSAPKDETAATGNPPS